ncbi:MAG: hypothetical protein AMXMBFR36_20020 [Acidobacteriota bacterium]
MPQNPRRSALRSLPAALPALAVATLLAAGCAPAGDGTAAGRAEEPERPDILLLTVDTQRADRLSAWGNPRPTSPILDRMATEGVRFAAARVHRPKTTASFTSIFTSSYCSDHLVRKIGEDSASCNLDFLAEELRALGYQTHAVVANAALAREFRFDQGFETYIETWKVTPKTAGLDPTGATAVTDLAVDLLGTLKDDRPYFLWVHYVDPHEPYSPAGPYRDLYQDDEHAGPPVEVPISDGNHRHSFGSISRKQLVDERTDLPFYVSRYDAEVRYADQEIDRLLAALRRRGDYDRMLTVMTSDHGESLGEHNYWFDHGMFAFQTCLHVPLIVRYPGVLAPRADADPVALIDLAPTILELAGRRLRDGGWRRGRSLVARMRGEASGADTITFSEAGYSYSGNWVHAAVDRRFALHHLLGYNDGKRVAKREGAKYALFDLVDDPGETVDVSDRFPEDFERLKRALDEWEALEPLPLTRGNEDCGDAVSAEAETLKQLKALGYVD